KAIDTRSSVAGSEEERFSLAVDLISARKYRESGILIQSGLGREETPGRLRWMLLNAGLSRGRDANKGSLALFRAATEYARKSGSRIGLATSQERLAEILVNDGFNDEAIDHLREARSIYAREGFRAGWTNATVTLARRTEMLDGAQALGLYGEAATV